MGQPVIIQIKNIFYPILAIVGVPANLLAIIIFSRGNCGLSKCTTRYLVGMAVGDLLVIISVVIFFEIVDGYFAYSVLNHTPFCRWNLAFHLIFIDWSVWLTVAFTFDRFAAICFQSLRTTFCTEKTAAIVIAVVCSLSILGNAPFYFIYEPREIIDNIQWGCTVKSSFYTLPIWVAFLWFEILFTTISPFVIVFLLNSLTIRHIILANRVRSGLRGNKQAEKHNDPETENRRKSIILLLAISGTFILLWILIVICYMYAQFTDIQFMKGNYNDPFTITELTGYMLRCLSCCTNTFIYAVSQRKFREEMKNIIKAPFMLITNVIK